MRWFSADLHVHTCLSPCAELDMTPRRIVRAACAAGLDILGITDHNSAENVPHVKKAASGYALTILGGMEITSSEEVHVLGLFDDDEPLFRLQNRIYAHLCGVNDARRFGDQVVVNEKDEVLGFNHRLLIGATTLSLRDLVEAIHALDGVAIASHVDRESFGLIGQLGFVPDGLPLDALEVSSMAQRDTFESARFQLVMFSDAHVPDRIGRARTAFYLENPCAREISLALAAREGRRVGA